MLKQAMLICTGCLVLFANPSAVQAEHFDFDPGRGPIFDPNLAAGDGMPYDWYYQGINLDYTGGFTDGRENSSFQDAANGNIPYIVFDGTSRSTAGHCLQIVFGGANDDSISPFSVQNLRFSYVDSGGVDRMLFNTDTSISAYNVVRMWIKNTGSSLYWRTKIADLDGANGSWNQSATMNIWRLDMNQADCTTNAKAAAPPLTFVTIIGRTGNYTVCDQDGSCHTAG